MRVTVVAGMLLLLAASAYADELPDAMIGGGARPEIECQWYRAKKV